MTNRVFDYPDQTGHQQSQDLIFLSHWSDDKWAILLKYTETRRFRAGDDIIHAGDTDRALYIVTEGSLEVLIPRGQRGQMVNTQIREAGAVIGEQAFIDGKPRSATIRAHSNGEMLRLSVEAFEVFVGHQPELGRDMLFDIARILSLKLRQANMFISHWIK